MEVRSSSIPIFVANLIVVEVKDHPKPIFKQYPHVATLEDLVGAFSHILEGFVYIEHVRAYIHYHIEDLGTFDIKSMYMSELLGDSGKVKPAYKHIEDLGFTDILDILEFKDKIIRYVLRGLHGEFIWLDRTYKITKESIRSITCLP